MNEEETKRRGLILGCTMTIAAVTPIIGEFGYVVFDIQPRVRAWLCAQKAERKIVFVSRELRGLFEEATEIIEPPRELLPSVPATMRSIHFDFWDPLHPERQKVERLVRWARDQIQTDTWLEIPYFLAGQWTASATHVQLSGGGTAPESPYIVMAARAREFDAYRNWPTDNWDELVNRIRENWRVDVMMIGRPPSTYFPPGAMAQLVSETDRLDSSLTLLNHALCSISSNSGPTHLSLMAGCPTFAWCEPQLRHFMERQTNPLQTTCRILPSGWNPSVDLVWRELDEWRQELMSSGLWREQTTRKRRPRLSMCMIARDSSKTIGAALSSVQRWVDEMVVVDTGSNDNTPAIAEALGAKVCHVPWEDSFSVARNESIRHATGEWIFWMDSDDTIDATNGLALRELADRTHPISVMGYVIQVHCPGSAGSGVYATKTVVDHVKLFRNVPAIRFTGRIHEQVLASIRALGGSVDWTQIAVEHSGSDQTPVGRERKRTRDLRLLQLELRDFPDSTFGLFNLGMTLLDAGKPTEALNALCRSLQTADRAESHVRKIYALLVQCYQELGRFETAHWTCLQGLNAFSGDPELLFRKGAIEQSRGMLVEAEQSFLAAVRSEPQRHFSSLDSGVMGAKAWHNLAIIYAHLNKNDKAAEAWNNVIKFEPNNVVAWRGLLDSLTISHDLTPLRNAFQSCAPMGVTDEVLAIVQARIVAQGGNYSTAVKVLENALANVGSIDLMDELCHIAFRGELLEVAERWLDELTRRCPADSSALRNLGIVHLRQNHPDKAIDCAKKALSLRPDYRAAQDLLAAATEAKIAITA